VSLGIIQISQALEEGGRDTSLALLKLSKRACEVGCIHSPGLRRGATFLRPFGAESYEPFWPSDLDRATYLLSPRHSLGWLGLLNRLGPAHVAVYAHQGGKEQLP